MAKYAVLIYEDESQWINQAPGVDEAKAQHWKFITDRADVISAGEALQPTQMTTSLIRASDGSFTVTDGPFVETKEALGGFYIVDAPDLDAAIELAKEIPAPFGGLEIRPVVVFENAEV